MMYGTTIRWVLVIACALQALGQQTLLDRVYSYPESSTCFCDADIFGQCKTPPSGCTTGMILKFRVVGPGWNKGGPRLPVITVQPLYFDPSFASPANASCEGPTRSYDNQIVACMLRAPTTGVFNFSIIDDHFQYYGMIINVTGIKLRWIDGFDGCSAAAPSYMVTQCYHGAVVSILGDGLEGMAGTFLSVESESNYTWGEVWNTTNELLGFADCAVVIINATHVACQLSATAPRSGQLRFHFQMYRDHVPEIDNTTNTSFWLSSGPIPVMYIELFGWGAENVAAPNATQPSWKGFTFNTTEHLIQIQLLPPIIRSITGDCDISAALIQNPFTRVWTPSPGTSAINCIHGGTITIKGGGFAAGGTFVLFGNTTRNWNFTTNQRLSAAERALDPISPRCYSITVVSNYELRCEVDLHNLTLAGKIFEVSVDSIAAYGSALPRYSSTDYSGSWDFFASVIAPNVTGVSGCVHSDQWPAGSRMGLGCIAGQNITFTGIGIYSTFPSMNIITLTPIPPITAAPPTVVCIAATKTSLTCRMQMVASYNPDAYFAVKFNIIGLVLPPFISLAQLVWQPMGPSPIAFAASAMATPCAGCLPQLYVIGGESSPGAAQTGVYAYNAHAANYGWVNRAALEGPRACSTAQGIPANNTLSSDNRFIYIFGGSNAAGSRTCYDGNSADRATLVYDVQNDASGWKVLEPLPSLSASRPINTTVVGDARSHQCHMFDVLVNLDVTITGMDIDIWNATFEQTWDIYYKAGSWQDSATSAIKWVPIASATFTPAAVGKMRFPGSFPSVELRTGGMAGRYAFYICSSRGSQMRQGSSVGRPIQPASPYFTILTGRPAQAGAFSPVLTAYPVMFTGTLIITPQAERCASLHLMDTMGTSSLVQYPTIKVMNFLLPIRIPNTINEIEVTIQATATNPLNLSNFRINVTAPSKRTSNLLGGVLPSAKWSAMEGFVRWSMSAKSMVSSPAFPFPSGSFTSYDIGDEFRLQPEYLGLLSRNPPTESLMGIWKLDFEDLNAADSATLDVKAAEIRLCWQQPGILGMASAAVDNKVFLTGGVGFGQLTFVSPASGNADVRQPASFPLYTDSFGSIQSLQVGLHVGGPANSTQLDIYLVVPRPNVASSLEGQWLCDGTSMDASGNERHGFVEGNVTFFGDDPGAVTKTYDVLHLYYGYVRLPSIPRTPTESRTAWVRIGYPIPSYNYLPTSRMCISSFGNEVMDRHDIAPFFILNGALAYEESGYPGKICHLESPRGFFDDAQWHHVAVTRDIKADIVLYIDGNEVARMTCDSMFSDTDDYSIGRQMNRKSAVDYFTGMLFDVRHYSTVISAADVKTLYKAGVGGQVVRLISGYWPQLPGMPTGLQRFGTADDSGGAPVVPNELNYPGTSTSTVFDTEWDLSEVVQPSAGRWLLVLKCAVTEVCLRNATDITWGVTIAGQMAKPSRGTVEFDGWTQKYTYRSYQPMNEPRVGHAMASVGDILYTIGGANSMLTKYTSPLASMEISDTSLPLPGWQLGPSMSVGRFLPAVAVVGNLIYVAGGWGPGGILSSVEMFDISSGTWTVLPSSSSLDTPRYGSAFGLIAQRMYLAGGVVPQTTTVNKPTYYSDTYSETVVQNMADAGMDYVDVQEREPAWSRMPGFGLVGANCRASDYDTSGAFFMGNAGSEQNCAVQCTSRARCYAYEYNTLTGDCYGRVEVGHTCGSELGNGLSSAYRAGIGETKTLQTTFLANDVGVKTSTVGLKVNAVEAGFIVVTGLTLNVLAARGQSIRVYYWPGTVTAAPLIQSSWTEVTTPLSISPLSSGTVRVTFSRPLTLKAGDHTLYIVAQLGASLGFTTGPVAGMSAGPTVGAVANQDYYVQFLVGRSATAAWTAPSANGTLNLALHYQTTLDVHTTRTHCYVPSTMGKVGRIDLPAVTDGFTMFARIMTTNPAVQQGFLHKSHDAANTTVEGGFAISLVQGYLSVKALDRWVPLGPLWKSGQYYHVLVSYQENPSPQWTVTIGDMEYNSTVPVISEAVFHDLYIGSEGLNVNPWQGNLAWSVVDCDGPRPLNFTPNASDDGIRPEDVNQIGLFLDRPVTLLGGSFRITETVSGGLKDKVFLDTSTLNVLTSNLVSLGDVSQVTAQLLKNFSFDVRCQMSVDPGAVRSTFDAGVWLGLPQRAPEQGQWWFKTSGRYSIQACDALSCGPCRACQFQSLDPNGNRQYLCYVPTSRGIIEITKLNVELEPTHDCP